MERKTSLRFFAVLLAVLQSFPTQCAFAYNPNEPERVKLPQMIPPRPKREYYPPSAIRKRLEAITLTAFKIDPSGQIVEPRTVGAPVQNELHKVAIDYLTHNVRFSMPVEPELSRVTKQEFRAVVTFNIECEERPRKNRPGKMQEADKDWTDEWIDITTFVRCERIRGT